MNMLTASGRQILARPRYWNANGYATAIVAVKGDVDDWAAYIGGCDPWSEEEAYDFVARFGCKLREDEARFFFPNIELAYRP